MKKLLLLIALACGITAVAQQVKVVSTQQVNLAGRTAYHPLFMPDGNRLLVTSEGYDGLALVNLGTKAYTQLTDMPGAGYYPAISEDGSTIVTRSMDVQNYTQDLYTLDVATKKVTRLAQQIAHTNQLLLEKGQVTYSASGKAVSARVKNISMPVTRFSTFVTEEDLKIVVYVGSVRTVIDPLKGKFGDWDPQYCWTSLSPNGKKILFTCRNNSYTCNLDGSGLVDLGQIRAPKWCGDDYVVGMNDKHDGYFFTKSDILIVKANGTQLQQLTTSSDEIKMYPAASADGTKIAFNTLDGKLYVMTISK